MKTIKRIFASLSMFMVMLTSNVFGVDPKYGVYEPIPDVARIGIVAILFLIGLFVIFNKKISNTIKALIVFGLIILGVAICVFI